MERHWAEKYVGLPYSKFDCATLCNLVQKEQFNNHIDLPSYRPESFRNAIRDTSDMIVDLQADFANKVPDPKEGDAVLMIGRGRLNHIGTVCIIKGNLYVLHAMRNVGMTVLHNLVALRDVGLTVEGYYRWK